MKQLGLFESIVLEAVARTGSTAGAYEAAQQGLCLSATQFQSDTVDLGPWGKRSKWAHRVRSIQQRLKSKGLIENGKRTGEWVLTEKARLNRALNQSFGDSLKVGFVTNKGIAFFGKGEGLKDFFRGQCSLVFCSPPYFTKRPYGHGGGDCFTLEQDYVDSICKMVADWVELLDAGGSLVLNLGSHLLPDSSGVQSLSTEMILLKLRSEFGLSLLQKSVWRNPNRPPTNPFVTGAKGKPKCRLKNQTEDVLWLSLDPRRTNERVNVGDVLTPYSEGYKRDIASRSALGSFRGRKHPSGQSKTASTYGKDLGGAIPSNYFEFPHEPAHSEYSSRIKAAGLPRHPAMCPEPLVEFWIKLCTKEDEIVADPCFGSGVTGKKLRSLIDIGLVPISLWNTFKAQVFVLPDAIRVSVSQTKGQFADND